MPISKLDKTRFLNVDLDLHSRSDLQPLVSALGASVIVLFAGRAGRAYEAHLELAWRKNQTPTSIVLAFCRLIERLPRAERERWDAAKTRSFDIGIEAPARNSHYWVAINPEAVSAAARIGAQIAITIYGPMKPPRKLNRRQLACESASAPSRR